MYFTIFIVVLGGKKLFQVSFGIEKYLFSFRKQKYLWQDHKSRGYTDRGAHTGQRGAVPHCFGLDRRLHSDLLLVQPFLRDEIIEW